MAKITKLRPADYAAAKALYINSFPESQRRPAEQIFGAERPMNLCAIYTRSGAADVFAGIMTVWHFDDFVYIEHFAIEPALRGKGIGAEALKIICSALSKPVVVEVERPDSADPMAAKRIDFYRRAGFHSLPFDYIQPPYAPGLPSVPLLLMVNGSEVPSPDHIARRLYSDVYGVK